MTLEHLERSDLSPDALAAVATIRLIIGQFQNSIVNLRWLSVDSAQPEGVAGREGGRAPRPPASLDLHAWAAEASEFHLRTLPRGVGLCFDLPEGLPNVAIGSAALSQAVFNLIRNAHQAIVGERGAAGGASGMVGGRVQVRAKVGDGPDAAASVELTIQDDGPGMTPEILRRSGEVFFTTKEDGSGLGLALVRALVAGWGGTMAFHSPPIGEARGTAVVLTLPVVGGAEISDARRWPRSGKRPSTL
jgi:signal transduction histidine kinase